MIITHGDLDGFVSSLVVMEIENIKPTRVYHFGYASDRDLRWEKLLGYQVTISKSLASDIEPVWFVDLSLRSDELEWARDKQKRSMWHWVDHRPSSKDFDTQGVFDTAAVFPESNQCAADILWAKFQDTKRVNPILESWVLAAHDRDLWIRKDPELCLKLDLMVKSQGRKKNGWVALLEAAKTLSPKEMVAQHPEWWQDETEAYERSVKLALATVSVIHVADLKVGMAYISGFGSDVGEALYSQEETADTLVMIQPLSDCLALNLRTRRDDLDLSILAKDLFQGGGHKQAAGGRLEEKYLKGGYNRIATDMRVWRRPQAPTKKAKPKKTIKK